MKAIDINNITHYTDKQYKLIIIHRAGDILIYIISSKTLSKYLLKQMNKRKSIKTRVHNIYQLRSTSDMMINHMPTNLILNKDKMW